ncbi:MAG: AAA family ATPase [Clostridioides sp.]|jgi:lon-related putative ATP-dependent protease|nr:AAA family ATPase [Clostridioides sp.]
MPKCDNTSKIKPSDAIVCQKRVKEAVEIGLMIDHPSYNIYMAGDAGLGKSRYIEKILREQKPDYKRYKDWCYVYNFENTREPMVMCLPLGKGIKFKEDVERLFENIIKDIGNVFDSESYELCKKETIDVYKEQKNELIKKLEIFGESRGFTLKTSSSGIVFVPKEEEESKTRNSSESRMENKKDEKTTEKKSKIQEEVNDELEEYLIPEVKELIKKEELLEEEIKESEKYKEKLDEEKEKEKDFKELDEKKKKEKDLKEELDEKKKKELDKEEKKALFEKNKKELEKITVKVVYKIKELESQAEEAMAEIDERIAKYTVKPLIEEIIQRYKSCKKIKKYFREYEKSILEDLKLISEKAETKDITSLDIDVDYFKKYKVNLFIDNRHLKKDKSAPIITELNPTSTNLFGKPEYDYSNGNVKTDFTRLLPGSLQRANGGYLILYADQLFRNATSWDLLKRTLRTQNIELDTQTAIKPQPIPLDVKIIIIGSRSIYHALYKSEHEFKKFFQVLVDFDNEVENNSLNAYKIAQYIALKCREDKLKHLEKGAVEEILKNCVRIMGDREKLSNNLEEIDHILLEANASSKRSDKEYITKKDIKKVLAMRKQRRGMIEERMNKSIRDDFTIFENSGERVGVINGLSVLDTGEYVFGRAARITVTSSPGKKGIVNIEREVDMSGSIHDKGVMILGGFLAENFAQDFMLSLNSYICFEQNYGGIDGDSASSAELYALLSSLSGVPIRQNIAVTGSINQKGDIQVVGGIKDKVEGFYSMCKIKGIDPQQGVIVPKKNIKNLVLSDELNKEIKAGRFKIYPIERIEEGIEILTGVAFDKISNLVRQKLKKFSDICKDDK